MKTTNPANIKPARKRKLRGAGESSVFVTIEAWMPSEINVISPLMDQLMRLIEGSRCVVGGEFAVELALREALNNAVVHGNAMDPHKLVKVHCRCESGKGVWLSVRDQGKGFDPSAVSDPLEPDSLKAEQGRGVYLMKWAMDQVVSYLRLEALKFACGKRRRTREGRKPRTKLLPADHIPNRERRRTTFYFLRRSEFAARWRSAPHWLRMRPPESFITEALPYVRPSTSSCATCSM
jgi:serine/threonine-protein kinase RsbW